eukprot:CAMPEP_0197575426 /NCGR_PEP_ID=MMETSP1326-20131121/834_1 /TAXON_ID=1155430 /ORGANISM="Genus nov. species nov., Strain RCC2288" /LENGTH=109 /DNA_ID=CAMNT_0043138193 /DNA_START=936 /DNA_END=1261 /DNA_ORIENTATION=+
MLWHFVKHLLSKSFGSHLAMGPGWWAPTAAKVLGVMRATHKRNAFTVDEATPGSGNPQRRGGVAACRPQAPPRLYKNNQNSRYISGSTVFLTQEIPRRNSMFSSVFNSS